MTYQDWIVLGGYSIITVVLILHLFGIRAAIRQLKTINDPDLQAERKGLGWHGDARTPERTGEVREVG